MSVVLAIGDLHYPFAHRDHLAFLKAVKTSIKPDHVVCLGDEIDAHALSVHEHNPEGYSAGHEHTKAKEDLARLYQCFPSGRSVISNHTARPVRLALRCGLPSVFLREYRDVLDAPRTWSWHDAVEIDGVRYIHGEGYSGPLGALKCAQAHMQPVVIGHIHSFAGIQFNANPKHLFWGFNVGCLIDRDAYAFQYAKYQASKPILGCGIIRDATPTFIPMRLTKAGRWTGVL